MKAVERKSVNRSVVLSCIVFLLFVNLSAAESIGNGWEIDYKSTHVIAEMDENGKVHVNFIGTLSNYGRTEASEVKIDVKILNDGVIPVKPEGGGTNLVCFGTKAVYTIENFESGTTKDWLIRAEITDPENVDKIDYQVKIFVRDASGDFENIYSKDKSVDVILADIDGDGLNDASEAKLGTDLKRKDTDGDGETDYQEVQAGTDPLDPKSNNKKGFLERVFGNVPEEAWGMFAINLAVFLIIGWTLGFCFGRSFRDEGLTIGGLGLVGFVLLVVWELTWAGESPFAMGFGIGIPAIVGFIIFLITFILIYEK